jgi:molybdopterin biosynthesis enzyme
LKVVKAFLGSRLFSAKGMRTYTLVKLTFDDQCRLIADPIDSLGEIHDLVDSDGFVKVPENDQYIDVNQEVTVHLLKGLAGKA